MQEFMGGSWNVLSLEGEWNESATLFIEYFVPFSVHICCSHYRFYWKNSVAREECDSECKKRMLCDLKSGRSNDRKYTCAKITEQVEIRERNDWRSWIFSGLTITYVWVSNIFEG